MAQQSNKNEDKKNPFETKRIAKFIDHQIPSMIASINRLAAAIERYNEINVKDYEKNNLSKIVDAVNDDLTAISDDLTIEIEENVIGVEENDTTKNNEVNKDTSTELVEVQIINVEDENELILNSDNEDTVIDNPVNLPNQAIDAESEIEIQIDDEEPVELNKENEEIVQEVNALEVDNVKDEKEADISVLVDKEETKDEMQKPEWAYFEDGNLKIVLQALEEEGEITCKIPRRNIYKLAVLMQESDKDTTNTIAAVYQKLTNNKFYGISDIDNVEYQVDASDLRNAVMQFEKKINRLQYESNK